MPSHARQLVRPFPQSSSGRLAASALTTSTAASDSNVENLNPRSRTIPQLAEHIVRWLNLPDVIGLEEIQDNSGARSASSLPRIPPCLSAAR